MKTCFAYLPEVRLLQLFLGALALFLDVRAVGAPL